MSELQAQLIAQISVANKYHSVIDTAMSVQTQEMDNNMVISQMTAMSTQHNQEMAAMRAQIQQCYLANKGSRPPPSVGGITNTSTGTGTGNTTTRKSYQALSDGPEGTIKTKKFYRKVENTH